MTITRTDLQNQAQSALVQYAIFRWETALVLALTIILTFLLPKPFVWWPRIGWPLLGLAGVGLLVYSSLTDSANNEKVLLQLFQEQFNPYAIGDKELRKDVEQALEYQERIEDQIAQQKSGLMRDRLEDTAGQIFDWVTNIYQLAKRIDIYRSDEILARDLNALPHEMQELREQLEGERNFDIKDQIEKVLATKQTQLKSMNELRDRMTQAHLQLDQSVASLATIYSQVQLIDAQSVGSDRAERLQDDIREQVARLNDLVESINEVYDHTSL
ncbi:MAG: hypothetical protein AAF639_12365 [Chloroflexota bacterium]